jgi:hypothetical protein
MITRIITAALLGVFLLSGCAAIPGEKIPAESMIPDLKWNLESYVEKPDIFYFYKAGRYNIVWQGPPVCQTII